MGIVRRIIAGLVWFFGGLLGLDSILSVPEHDIRDRNATPEDFRSH